VAIPLPELSPLIGRHGVASVGNKVLEVLFGEDVGMKDLDYP
jgi:hypothetical protein